MPVCMIFDEQCEDGSRRGIEQDEGGVGKGSYTYGEGEGGAGRPSMTRSDESKRGAIGQVKGTHTHTYYLKMVHSVCPQVRPKDNLILRG